MIPLADLLDPYLGELAEAQRLLRAAMRGKTFDAQGLASQLQDELPSLDRLQGIAARFDLPLLQRAIALFLDATAHFARALREAGPRVDFPEEGARFEAEIGLVVIGRRGNDAHTPGAALIVDPGGDDTYHRRPAVGGAVSVIVDLGGDDRYRGSDVAVHGLSAIVDFSGNDDYAMAGPGLGAAIAGASLVVDFSGDDRYAADVFGEGAAAFGLGAILDLAGDDSYRLRAGGQGFGLAEGVGLLWDRAGSDTYVAAGLADVYGRGGGLSLSQGAAFGYRTLLGGGIGILRDDGGDDRYEAEMFTQGTGYYYGLGLLWDRGGADRYRAVRYAQGAGVHEAVGVLRDESGHDRYELTFGVGQGMGLDLAVGVLLDGAGDDRYAADVFGEGAAAFGLGAILDLAGNDSYRLRAGGQGFGLAEGVGLLWDRAGNDTYVAAGLADVYGRGGGLSLAQGAAFGYRTLLGGGIGILRDDGGDDRYEAEMYAQGAGYYYGLGLLWDRGGADRYRAVRYAQGAGVHEAVGVLRDESGADHYELAVGVGQGMGLDLAVGVLADAAGDDRYRAGLLAQGAATANGIGIVLDGGGVDAFHVEDARLAWGSAEWFRGLPTLGLIVYDPVRASFSRKEGAFSPPPESAGFGGPLGDAPVRHDPESARRCPDAVTTATPISMSLADALRALAPAFAGEAFEPGLYAEVQQRLTARLEESLAELPRGDFEVSWSLSAALRCAAAAASAGDAQSMWDAMERMLAAKPATPFAGAIIVALRERPAPPQQMERILAVLDSHRFCSIRSAALRLRGSAGTMRATALPAAQTALRSTCWQLQASALAVLRQLGVAPADRAALPTFLRSVDGEAVEQSRASRGP